MPASLVEGRARRALPAGRWLAMGRPLQSRGFALCQAFTAAEMTGVQLRPCADRRDVIV
jgi:hypothetical protein